MTYDFHPNQPYRVPRDVAVSIDPFAILETPEEWYQPESEAEVIQDDTPEATPSGDTAKPEDAKVEDKTGGIQMRYFRAIKAARESGIAVENQWPSCCGSCAAYDILHLYRGVENYAYSVAAQSTEIDWYDGRPFSRQNEDIMNQVYFFYNGPLARKNLTEAFHQEGFEVEDLESEKDGNLGTLVVTFDWSGWTGEGMPTFGV